MVRSDSRLAIGGHTPGGKGEGREEADTRAGACRRPRGSLRVLWDIRSTEPVGGDSQRHASRPDDSTSSGVNALEDPKTQGGKGHPAQPWADKHIPGTSSVSVSLRTPKLHFSGLTLTSSAEDELEMGAVLVALAPPKNLLHPEGFVFSTPSGPSGLTEASPSWDDGSVA